MSNEFKLYIKNTVLRLTIFFLITSCIRSNQSFTKEIEEEILESYKILLNSVESALPQIKDTLFCFNTEGIPTLPSENPQEKSAPCTTTNDPTRLFSTVKTPTKISIIENFVDSDMLYIPIIEAYQENLPLATRNDFSIEYNLEEFKKKTSHKMLFRTTKRVKEKLRQPLSTLEKCFLNLQSPTDISNETYHPVFLQKKFSNYTRLFTRYTEVYRKSKIALELLQKLCVSFDEEGVPQKFIIKTSGRSLQGNINNLLDKSVLFVDEVNSSWMKESLITLDSKIYKDISPGLASKSLPHLCLPTAPGEKGKMLQATNGFWKNAPQAISKQQTGIYFLRITQQINKILTHPTRLLQEVISEK